MLSTWDTVSALDRIFNDVMGAALGTSTNPLPFDPATDVRVTEDQAMFVLDVPGVSREALEITLERHVLTVRGFRKFESLEKEQVMLGRAYGAFEKTFSLGEGFDEERLEADLAEGILTVRIPKQPKAKPRKINIGGPSEAKRLEQG